MKKVIYLVGVLLIVSCASTKQLTSLPVGQWDFTITGTPNGDFTGVFLVVMEGEKYSASLKTQGSELKFDQTLFDQKTKKLTGSFYYESNLVDFESTTEEDSMKGWVSAGGGSWPFQATRKK